MNAAVVSMPAASHCTDEHVLAVGTVLADRFEVRKLLGKGGFGLVYLVRDQQDDELYAFKTLRDVHSASATIAERFRHEARTWLKLERHPNVVLAHFVEKFDNRLYLAMEYVRADARGANNLQEYLSSGPIRSDQLLRWAVQISYGMEHAYAAGLQSHRDLKPSNILITPDHQAKITDLGLASVPDAKESFIEMDLGTYTDDFDHLIYTRPGQGMGTPTHMAPEQFDGAASCDDRSDIYSFGVILYQGVTGGDLPFRADIPKRTREGYAQFFEEMRRLHRSARPDIPPTPLRDLIAKCLQKDPGDRYRTFGDLRVHAQELLRSVAGATEPMPEFLPMQAAELARRGHSFLQLKKPDEAEALFTRAIESDARCAVAWNGMGLTLQRKNRPHEAVRHFATACEIDDQFHDGWCNYGAALARLGKNADAIRAFEFALDVEWSYTPAWMNLGRLYYDLGEMDRSAGCFDTALRFKPDEPSILVNSAIVLSRLGRHQEALNHAHRLCELHPGRSHHWATYAHVAWYARTYAEAHQSASEAVRCDDTDHHAWGVLGLVRLAQRDFGRAEAAFTKAFELAPDRSVYSANRAIAQYGLGRERQADADLRRATVLEPLEALSWYNRGTLHLLMGEYPSAKNFFDRALSIEGRQGYIHYNAAVTLHAAEAFEEAESAYDRALEFGFDHNVVRVNRDLSERHAPPRMRPLPSFRPASSIKPLYFREYLRVAED